MGGRGTRGGTPDGTATGPTLEAASAGGPSRAGTAAVGHLPVLPARQVALATSS